MKRQREDENLGAFQSNERTLIVIVPHSLHQCQRTFCKHSFQFRSNRNDLSPPVIDCDSKQMFTIAKALHQTLQGLVRSRSPGFLHIAGQTLTEHFGATLQFATE